jgi:uncharacterized protein (DUF1800 family)
MGCQRLAENAEGGNGTNGFRVDPRTTLGMHYVAWIALGLGWRAHARQRRRWISAVGRAARRAPLNRAGFGADTRAVERAVERGQAATVQGCSGRPWIQEPFYARRRGDVAREPRSHPAPRSARERRRACAEDASQKNAFLGWWVDRMLEGEDALVERMTLYWHGHFTSSFRELKSSYEMIAQNQVFRRLALGSFATSCRRWRTIPRCLIYLDNDQSRRQAQRELRARAARALHAGRGQLHGEGRARGRARLHGWGAKTGRFHYARPPRPGRQGDPRPARALRRRRRRRHPARAEGLRASRRATAARLLRGRRALTERLEHYAGFLFENHYRIDVFLRELFLDPDFYRDESSVARVASPIDYLVGCARRLGCDPGGSAVALTASVLGEQLFGPPSVKGWERGLTWIRAHRPELPSRLAAVLLGEVRVRDLVRAEKARRRRKSSRRA